MKWPICARAALGFLKPVKTLASFSVERFLFHCRHPSQRIPSMYNQTMKGKRLPLRGEVIEDTCAHLKHRAPFITCMSVYEVTSPRVIQRRLKKLSRVAAVWTDEKLRGRR